MTDRQLKEWERRQRKEYWAGTLSSSRILKLTQSGFSFDNKYPERVPSSQRKAVLLEMAEKKLPRPKHTTTEGRMLSSFVTESSNSFDRDFSNRIRQIAPSWFPFLNTERECLVVSKDKILQIAKSGDEKPSGKSRIGRKLRSLTFPSSDQYDPEFRKELNLLRPEWFNQEKEERRRVLLGRIKDKDFAFTREDLDDMRSFLKINSGYRNWFRESVLLSFPWLAENISEVVRFSEEEIKDITTPGGKWFCKNISQKGDARDFLSSVFPNAFSYWEEYKQRLSWESFEDFVKAQEEHKKAVVLFCGKESPLYDDSVFQRLVKTESVLGLALFLEHGDKKSANILKRVLRGEDVLKTSRDMEFLKRRVYNEKWGNSDLKKFLEMVEPSYKERIPSRIKNFGNRKTECKRKKAALLEIALSGERRPSGKEWKNCWFNWTTKGNKCYDPCFVESIKRVNPSWFEKEGDWIKERLIRMAENGEDRPSYDKSLLGKKLSSYTSSLSSSFDFEFRKRIEQVRPDWFDFKKWWDKAYHGQKAGGLSCLTN